ncbi:MAG TPA: DUF6049 family protein [Streptosporangiaceae bacterium]|nr:DUF6049 family protein [Streptosporangiaceae bacterium]
MRSLSSGGAALLWVAAIAALTVIAPVAGMTTQAQASPAAGSGVTLAIDSVTPQVAAPDKTITVTGTITNGTGAALTGSGIQLYTSQAWFTTRDDMNHYASGAEDLSLSPVGNPGVISSGVRPGETVSWHAQFTEAAAGYPRFGVYPLRAVLTDVNGVPEKSASTLLPYWSRTSQLTKLKIAWVWPLIDQPHRQACPALTSNGLAPSVAADGRLSGLLAAGTANPRSALTLAIDPALLGDLAVMAGPNGYSTGGTPATCKDAIPEKTSHAAADWLATLKSATATQPALITPYGNTDVAALALHGLNTDLTNAYRLGQQVSGEVLGRSFGTDFALPPGGLADPSVLTTLATSAHVTSVVLDSSEMPAVDTQFYADDAVTSFRNMAGLKMNVLLADHEITGLLRGASPTMSASAQFGLEQQFLAETAMISSELPESHRSVVVSPPENWGPSEALASKLLQESQEPWLEPVALSSLAGSHDSESQINRRPPAPAKSSPRELSAGYLAAIKGPNGLDGQLGLYKSLLYQAPVNYTTGLDEALAATESAAWRDGPTAAGGPTAGGAAGGQALISKLSAYLTKAQNKVRIISSPEITMAGSSGVLPVNIQNTLEQDVQVRLVVSVPVPANGGARPLQVARIDKPIRIPAGQIEGVKLHVSSAPNGTTNLTLSLASKDGKVVPRTGTPLRVHSTRYGQAILILIAGAIGLLVLSSLWRSGRRALAGAGGGPRAGNTERAADADQSGDSAGTPPDWTEPGNVIGGTQNLTEAPDDLADARRWADDT